MSVNGIGRIFGIPDTVITDQIKPISFIIEDMTTFFEETDNIILKDDISSLLVKYEGIIDENTVLKDLITFSHLMIHTKKVKNSLLSNCKYIDFDIFSPQNVVAMDSMRRIASCMRVTKVSRINLSNFFSVEASLLFSFPESSDVIMSISFLRNADVLRKDGKWSIIDYSIHCGQDVDNMFCLMKMSFAHKGSDDYSTVFGFEVILEDEKTEDPEVEECSDAISIISEYSDGYTSGDSGMSQEDGVDNEDDDEDEEEDKGEEKKEEEKDEEELICFEVHNDILETLVGLLLPSMPMDIFLMYLVSLQFISFYFHFYNTTPSLNWETTWDIDERFYELMVDRPV